MYRIISEDFDLTPAIRTEVEEKIGQVVDHMNKDNPISIYLSKSGDHIFTVRMNVRYGKKSISSTDSDRDFHIALNKAKSHLVRQVDDRKKKEISRRHKRKAASNVVHDLSLSMDTEKP